MLFRDKNLYNHMECSTEHTIKNDLTEESSISKKFSIED